MSAANKFERAKLLDPANAQFSGQERVNAEIFTAVEILARKLERSETERDRLARRLALIESAATVDEKTGKLYLPVLMDQGAPQQTSSAPMPRWMVTATMMSGVVALFSLGMVLFHDPSPPLTPDQLAALEFLKTPQLATISPESKGWKHLDTTPMQEQKIEPVVPPPAAATNTVPSTVPPPLPASAIAALPDAKELAKQEQTAEAPKPASLAEQLKAVAVPVVPSTVPPPLPVKSAENASPQNVLIPGEDRAAEKNEVRKLMPHSAKKKESGAEITKTSDDDADDDTATLTPDKSLPAKLAKLEKRAFQGLPEAQHDLATLYASGKLVAQNYPRAIYWFRKAADGGVANAHYNLGVIYQQGLGVKPDMSKALGWYEKAAELGHPEAMYNLGIAYVEGVGTKTDIEKGVSYFKRAANAGVAQAAYNLGVLYESNFIGKMDTDKAMEWYRVAANEGHADAIRAINRLKGGATNDQALTLAKGIEPAAGATVSPEVTSRISKELAKQGLLPVKVESVTPPQLEDAIRSYQKKVGIQQDGQPSLSLLDRMLQQPVAAGK